MEEYEIKFEDFWNQLSKLLLERHDFETIDQNKKFEARNSIQSVAITPESSGKKRVISMAVIKKTIQRPVPETIKLHK